MRTRRFTDEFTAWFVVFTIPGSFFAKIAFKTFIETKSLGLPRGGEVAWMNVSKDTNRKRKHQIWMCNHANRFGLSLSRLFSNIKSCLILISCAGELFFWFDEDCRSYMMESTSNPSHVFDDSHRQHVENCVSRIYPGFDVVCFLSSANIFFVSTISNQILSNCMLLWQTCVLPTVLLCYGMCFPHVFPSIFAMAHRSDGERFGKVRHSKHFDKNMIF